jgi:hypothetical protein
MTEGEDKTRGFVVDLNIHRLVTTTISRYASILKPDVHPKEVIKSLMQSRVISVNADHWEPTFGNNQ